MQIANFLVVFNIKFEFQKPAESILFVSCMQHATPLGTLGNNYTGPSAEEQV